MRSLQVVIALAVAATLACVLWLACAMHTFHSLADQVHALQAVSPGMSRQAVIERLGQPIMTDKNSELTGGRGEVLMYGSWRRSNADIWVVLDDNGRVVSAVYPDMGLPSGGILVGSPAAVNEP